MEAGKCNRDRERGAEVKWNWADVKVQAHVQCGFGCDFSQKIIEKKT
jgi:hypothetical protein